MMPLADKFSLVCSLIFIAQTVPLSCVPRAEFRGSENGFVQSRDQHRAEEQVPEQLLKVEAPGPGASPVSSVDGLAELIDRIGRTELVQLILRMLGRIRGEGDDENGEKRAENDDATRGQGQRLERRSPSMKTGVEQQHADIFKKVQRQSDQPKPSPAAQHIRSPTLGRLQTQTETAPISESIDAKPVSILKNEWKKALFGRSGLLTEIFHIVNDKRKQGLAMASQQQAAPNLGKSGGDFAKIVEALLQKAQNGNFDEPLPEIPFIGICNRLSCADIYKALDEFRRSEFFSNFQTAISLLHDPKGLDTIGELLANPELIENFSGPESLGEIFATKRGAKGTEIAENTDPDSENIGVDFSPLVDGTETESKSGQKPQISASIDPAETPDYYSFVEKKALVGQEEWAKREKANGALLTTDLDGNKGASTTTKAPATIDRVLPEIAESIDEPIEDEDFPGGGLTFEKNEWIFASNNASKHRKVVLTPTVEIKLGGQTGKRRLPSGESGRAAAKEGDSMARTRSTVPTATVMPSSRRTTTKTVSATLSSSTPTTATRRNFRREDDYYSMYYDDNERSNG